MAQHVSSRINILSGHLAATAMHTGNSEVVERNSTRAESRPAPGGGAGTLTITDNRTGKQYTVKVGEGGTINAAELKRITAGGDGVGLRTYDPGYVNTAACISRICYIDGDKGILRYRGYPIEQLAEKSNFLEVAYLLVYGELPTQRQEAGWKEAVMRHSELPVEVEAAMAALPPAAHPMAVLLTGICALSALHPEQNPVLAGQAVYNSRAMQDLQIARLLGTMPAIAARAYHKCTGMKVGHSNQRLSYAENFLYLLDSRSGGRYRPHPAVVRALDVMFILHAEHEMNCSTAAARHLASSGVDVHIAIAGAVGALYGPLHGGANEAVLRMLRRIGSKDRVPEFIAAVKGRTEKLFGFGHRVYKNFDPRAKIIREVAQEVFALAGHDPLIEVAEALQAAALADPYFIDRRLYPNVDFFSGLVYQALGFPPSFFTVLFALPRVAGYLSHWRESLSDPDTRIMRPQQDYRGVWLRDFTALDARQEGPGAGMSELPPSKAHLRRVAGTDWQ